MKKRLLKKKFFQSIHKEEFSCIQCGEQLDWRNKDHRDSMLCSGHCLRNMTGGGI